MGHLHTYLNVRRLLLVLASMLLLAVLLSATVSAHATLLRSDPNAGVLLDDGPTAITLWFTEGVELEYSRIDVLQRAGTRLFTGTLIANPDDPDRSIRLQFNEPLSEGAYTVVWSTLSSVDSHVAGGYFSFSVGGVVLPSAEEEAALAATVSSDRVVPIAIDATARWLSLLGQAVIGGILLALATVFAPLLRGIGDIPVLTTRRFRPVLFVALMAVVVGHLLAAVVQIMNATRSTELSMLGDPLWSLLTGTRFGGLWVARAILIVALAILLHFLVRRERFLSLTGQGRTIWIWAGWLTLLLMITTSLGSHAASFGGNFSRPVIFDLLHLVGTAIWTGGVIALLLALPVARARGAAPRTAMLRRFSWLALGAFAVLAITGMTAAVRQIYSFDGLTSTRYGLWFMLKMVMVVVAAGLGAWHWLVVQPAMAGGGAEGSRAQRGFRKSLPTEMLALIVAVVITGLLTASIPARDLVAPGPSVFATTRLTSVGSFTLRLAPGQLGQNDVSVVIAPVDEEGFGLLQGVSLRLEHAELPSETIALEPGGERDSWTFRGSTNLISEPGEWKLTAIAQRNDALPIEVEYDIVADATGMAPLGITIERSERTNSLLLLGILWLIAGATLVVLAGLMARSQRNTLALMLIGLAIGAAAVGLLVMLTYFNVI